MNQTVISAGPRRVEGNPDKLGGYVVSDHAKSRMTERCVAAEEVEAVLRSRTTRCEVDCAGIAQYRGSVRGRPIRVTVNELANVIVTVAAPAALHHADHWLSVDASLRYGL
jgi:hypothetical protein